MQVPRTVHNADPFEMMSGLHKSIRRGDEELAMCFAQELLRGGEAGGSTKMHGGMLWNYLVAVAHEDIGVADLPVVTFVNTTMAQCREWHKLDKTKDCDNLVANCVVAMCRAKKTRYAGNLSAYIRHRTDKAPEVPDHALDQHTQKGKALGRGQEFFEAESQRLSNPHPDFSEGENGHDKYSRLMSDVWKAQYPTKPPKAPKAEPAKTESPKGGAGGLF